MSAPISLGPGPVILPLVDFAEGGLQAIFDTTSKEEFSQAFDDFFTKNAEITVNGHHVSRQHYKESFYNVIAGKVSSNVVFDKTVSVPKDPEHPVNSGTVGLFFTATVTKPSPESSGTNKLQTVETITASFNVVIVQEKPLVPPIEITFAPRRVSVLNEVATTSSTTLLPLPPA